MKKIILATGAVIPVQEVTLEPHFVIEAADRAAFLETWDLLTDRSLQKVDVYQDDVRVAGFTDCELTGTQTVHSYDGSMVAHFYLTGLPTEYVDPEYEAAYKILAGEMA